jgi:Ankyrin repeats (many copies)
MRDDIHQALPIHLAAKWGVAEDVVMEILVAHPEGYFIRDGSGLTPMDYANQLRLSSDRERMRDILSHAPLLCKVSKAAQIRVVHEQETKMRSIEESHAAQLTQWEEKYLQEKLKSRNWHQSLKQDLKTVTQLADTSSRQLDEKVAVLAELTSKCAELEARLEKERKQFNSTLDVQKAQMQSVIEAEVVKSKELLQHVAAKGAEIGELEEKVENPEAVKISLEVEPNSEREVVGMMVEEVKKLSELEALLENKVELIKDLEFKVEMGELAREILSQKLEEIEKARMEATDKLNQTQAERNAIQVQNTDLLSQLNNSNRLADLYKARIEQLQGWVKGVTLDMDSWRTSDPALFALPESQQEKSSSDSKCDNATLETEEETYDSTHQIVVDREQTAYAGVEVSLEPIADELQVETMTGTSPT